MLGGNNEEVDGDSDGDGNDDFDAYMDELAKSPGAGEGADQHDSNEDDVSLGSADLDLADDQDDAE